MVAEWRDFTVVTKLIKNFKSLYGFGGRCFNIRDVCMDFEPYFKVYNLVSIRPKSMKLGQMTNLNVVFHMVELVYRLVNQYSKLAPVPRWISEWPILKYLNQHIPRKRLQESSCLALNRENTMWNKSTASIETLDYSTVLAFYPNVIANETGERKREPVEATEYKSRAYRLIFFGLIRM